MRLLSLSVVLVAITGCAATPMASDTWTAKVAEQQSTLRLDERCCTDLDALSFHAFDGSLTEFHVDSTTPVAEFRGNPTPALAVELPPVSADQVIEFFSFSDRERGLLRLTVHTFIRPDVVFLDAAGTVVGEHPAPVMCMGVKSGDIGLWARFPVPEGATRAVFLPSIAQPRQTVDTRTSGNQLDALGVGGRAIAEGIAESRQSYLSEASFTLMGRVGLERAAADSPDLGRRCRN